MHHRTILAAALVACSQHSALAQGGLAEKRGPHDSITVTTLTFPGAVHVSLDALKPTLFTRPSPCRLPFLIPLCKLTPSQIFTDRRRTTSAALADDITKVRVYLWRRGYRDAQVDTVLTPGKRGTAVAFTIDEGPPTIVSTLSVTQKSAVLSDRELSDIVELREGKPLDLFALDSTLAHLKVAVWNRGYGDVKIDTSVPRPDAAHLVPVRIDVDPRWITRVGHVGFDGNAYLSEATLRRGVVLQPGTLYTHDAVLESQMRLFQSPAIARALVITPASGDSVKAITVAVTETPEHQGSVTLGFNTIDFGQAAAEFRHNALGAGRWLSVRGAVGNLLASQLDGNAIFQQALTDDDRGDPEGFLDPTYQASLTLTQPWIGSARTSASLAAFAGRRSLPNIVIDEDVGATLGLVHELAPRTPIGINYRMEEVRVRGTPVYFCAGYGICDLAAQAKLVRTQRLAPIGVSAWVDRADDLEIPSRGYTAVIDAEQASSATGSTYQHTRVSTDASLYHALRRSAVTLTGGESQATVLALHFQAGWVRPSGDDLLYPRARFYAGGMQSVRGFAENQLGPTVLQVRRPSLLNVGCTDATIATRQCDPSAVPSDQFFPQPVGGQHADWWHRRKRAHSAERPDGLPCGVLWTARM